MGSWQGRVPAGYFKFSTDRSKGTAPTRAGQWRYKVWRPPGDGLRLDVIVQALRKPTVFQNVAVLVSGAIVSPDGNGVYNFLPGVPFSLRGVLFSTPDNVGVPGATVNITGQPDQTTVADGSFGVDYPNGMAEGSYSIVVHFGGTAEYDVPQDVTVRVRVARVPTAMTATALGLARPLSSVQVSGTLVDSSGQPLTGVNIGIALAGQQTLASVQNGSFGATIPAPAIVGSYQLLVTFAGTSGQYAPASPVSLTLNVTKSPITVNAILDPPSAAPGEGVIVRGSIQSPGGFVGSLDMQVGIGGSVTPAKTNPDGSFSAVVRAPASLGNVTVSVVIPESTAYMAGSASLPLTVVKGVVAISLSAVRSTFVAGETAVFTGRVQQNARGVPGAVVKLLLNGQSIASAPTNSNGEFSFSVPFAQVGAYDAVAAFDGTDRLQGGQSNVISLTVSVVPVKSVDTVTNMGIRATTVEAGKPQTIDVLLQTKDFQPIPGAKVLLVDGGQVVADATTKPDGTGVLTYGFPNSGKRQMKAFFSGMDLPDQNLHLNGSESATVEVTVVPAAFAPDWLLAAGVGLGIVTLGWLASTMRQPSRQPKPAGA